MGVRHAGRLGFPVAENEGPVSRLPFAEKLSALRVAECAKALHRDTDV